MKLSRNMRTALQCVVEGRSLSAALGGSYGRNIDASLVALGKRGLLKYGRTGGTMGWETTPAGVALVNEWRVADGLAPITPDCVCAGPRFDPDTPCPVEGHGKAGRAVPRRGSP